MLASDRVALHENVAFLMLALHEKFYVFNVSTFCVFNVSILECTNIENATYSCKAILLEDNIKTVKMRRTKWNYHKERNDTTNYFIWKFNFGIENLKPKNGTSGFLKKVFLFQKTCFKDKVLKSL